MSRAIDHFYLAVGDARRLRFVAGNDVGEFKLDEIGALMATRENKGLRPLFGGRPSGVDIISRLFAPTLNTSRVCRLCEQSACFILLLLISGRLCKLNA